MKEDEGFTFKLLAMFFIALLVALALALALPLALIYFYIELFYGEDKALLRALSWMKVNFYFNERG